MGCCETGKATQRKNNDIKKDNPQTMPKNINLTNNNQHPVKIEDQINKTEQISQNKNSDIGNINFDLDDL